VQARYTTQAALERERRIFNMERRRRKPSLAPDAVDEVRRQLAPTKLSKSQRETILAIHDSDSTSTVWFGEGPESEGLRAHSEL